MTFRPKDAPKILPKSAKAIEVLTEPGLYRDRDTTGLSLQVAGPKNKSWVLRFELNGKARTMGLGSYNVFTLTEARKRAREARGLLADGIDPIDQRRAQRAKQAATTKPRSSAKLSSSLCVTTRFPLSAAWRFVP